MMLRAVINIALIVLASSHLIAQESRNPGQASLAGQISGQVRYAGGQPAFDVLVSCDQFNAGLVAQQTTDRNGRFTFRNLGASQYTIRVRIAGYSEESQNVELLTTPSAYIQFQLRADASEKPVSVGLLSANVPVAAKKEFDQAEREFATGKKEDLEAGIRHLEKALSIYPNFVEAQLRLGTAHMDLSNWEKAEQALRKTIEINPKAANAFFALGEVYLRQKKYDQAEKALQDGLAIESRSAQGHLALARVYWEKVAGVKEESQFRPSLEKSYAEVNQALQLDPNLAAAHLLKGNLYFKVHRAADAQREFEEYLRLNPKGPLADQTRAFVERIKKALEQEKKP